ncbi:MAG: hypothetical protein ACLP9L_15650 [Thermoguttaceae bacterium]
MKLTHETKNANGRVAGQGYLPEVTNAMAPYSIIYAAVSGVGATIELH